MQFDIKDTSSIIKVIGVGGGGSNAVNNMFKHGIAGVDFVICNTDNQALQMSEIPTRIQLGPALTEGRGAGSKPNVGREACLESEDDIKSLFSDNTKMVFITAGMGGGTGTGAAPVIAKAAQELDILTVGIVTLPFTFEGRRRQKHAEEGIEELKKNVDALIIISNDKLRQIHGNLTLTAAFSQADNILTTAAKGIAEIITKPGYINVDFEDVNTVMRGSGVAIMGTATVEGDDRARRAAEAALNSPLLEENDIKGAKHILLNISSGQKEVTLEEVNQITEYVQEEAGHGTDLIWGNCYDEKLGDKLSVTVIATGFERKVEKNQKMEEPQQKVFVSLDDRNTRNPHSSIFEQGHRETNKSITVEFQGTKQTARESANKPTAKDSINKPIPTPTPPKREIFSRPPVDNTMDKNMHVKLTNPHMLNELENEPAYLRRNIRLEDVPHSSEPSLSKWTLSADDELDLKRGNSYLHDNVD